MKIPRRIGYIGLGVTAALAAATGGASAAIAHHDGPPKTHPVVPHDHDAGLLINSALGASVPGDPQLFSLVSPSPLAWTLENGHVSVTETGHIDLQIHGLLTTSSTPAAPTYVSGALYCNGTLWAQTLPVPIGNDGNVHIHAVESIPSECPVPAVLVEPATAPTMGAIQTNVYVAFDGTA